jgi:hypothetical protein
MNLIENKGLIPSFFLIIALLFISVLLNMFFVSGSYNYAVKNNKIFNILIEKNQKNDQFVFSTKNHLKKVSNLLKFIPNISFIIFDIDANDSVKIENLLELQSDVKLGFLNFNDNLLEKLSYFGYHFLLNLNFSNKSVNNLFFDIRKSFEENEENIKTIENTLEAHNSGIYMNIDDIKSFDSDKKIVDFLLKFNPFVVGNSDGCNDKTHICFIISDDIFNDGSLLKFREIINQTKLNEKWLIAIKYQGKFESQIKNLINSTNSGYIDIKKNLLESIMES